MSVLGNSVPNLPTTGDTASEANKSVNYTVAGLATKLTEATEKMYTDYNTSAPWTKLGAQTPTIKQLQATTTKELAANAASGKAMTPQELAAVTAINDRTGEVQPSAQQMNQLTGTNTAMSKHEVTLTDADGNKVVFIVMPEITEGRNVSYEAVAPTQAPGAFQKYKGTDSVQWTVSARLISRTTPEATQRHHDLNILRSWTEPYFGANTEKAFPTKLGAPPPVLQFAGFRGLVGKVPVVLTSLNWQWPSDVDYIPTNLKGADGFPVPFPAVMTVSLTLVESFSPMQLNRFSLLDYRNGDIEGAYSHPTGESGKDAPTAYKPPAPQSAQVSGQAVKSRNKVAPKPAPKVISERKPVPANVYGDPVDNPALEALRGGNMGA